MKENTKRDSKGRFVKGEHYSPETEFKKGHTPNHKGKTLDLPKRLNLPMKKIVDMYVKGNLSGRPQITKKFNCSLTPIYMILNENKVKVSCSKFNSGKPPLREFKKGNIPHCKGKTKENYEPLRRLSKNLSKTLKKLYAEGKLNGRSGEKSPAWRGGISFEPYDLRFTRKFKRAIRKRDNYICLKCGKHQEKESRALSIHHVNYDKKLSIPQNCISLCWGCHSEVNFNRKHWTKFFQSLLNEKYNYEYSETQEIILNIENER